jgi:phosphoribosylanthranilate isomerase
LVFHRASARCLTPGQAERVAAALPEGVLRVGVFMDQPLAFIHEADDMVGFDLVQLHGAESAETCRAVGFGRCVKAVVVADESAVDAAARHESEYLLIDRPRTGGAALGGPPDWALAGLLAARRQKTLLAGALTAENVAEAIKTARPWGVDVSSGVESAPGVKDAAKLRAFFAAVRRAEAA